MDYYKELNATLAVEKDGYFIDLVTCTWNLLKSGRYVTPKHIESLENIMYEKIRERTSSKEDEGKSLRRAIKYIDMADTGALTYDQFDKLLVSIGCLLKPDDVKILFWKFAEPESRKICADKISSYFALKGVEINPNIPPKFKLEADAPKDVIEKIKKVLLSNGPNGVHEIGELFRKFDASGNKKINRREFKWLLRENGHRLCELDFERLFKYFDRNHDDVISYEEFLRVFRGELTSERKVEIYELYKALDVTGEGKIPFEALMNLYRVESNPEV